MGGATGRRGATEERGTAQLPFGQGDHETRPQCAVSTVIRAGSRQLVHCGRQRLPIKAASSSGESGLPRIIELARSSIALRRSALAGVKPEGPGGVDPTTLHCPSSPRQTRAYETCLLACRTSTCRHQPAVLLRNESVG